MARRNGIVVSTLTAAVLTLGSMSGSATAADKITLRLADSVPKTHPISVYLSKFWMDEVTKLTHGEVQFQWFPAGQMGKARDLLELARSGTVDIARVGPSYTPAKLPLSAVDELPGMISSSCEGSQAMWELTKTGGGGILAKDDYAPLGLHVVFAASNPPYEVMTTKREVKLPDDMKGLKLKTLGGASDDAALKVGAVPVQMSVADLYVALQRGTVDGRFGSFQSVFSNSTQDILQHSTLGAEVGSFGIVAVMSDAKWKKLPKNVQQAMLQAGDKAWKNFCTHEEQSKAPIMKKLEAEHHWKVYKLTAADKQAWHKTFAPVQEKWAKTLDSRGKPGTKVLKAFRAAVEKAGAGKQ